MSKPVVNNACLNCSAGSIQSNLKVQNSDSFIEHQQIATGNDAVPFVNIVPFGFCKILMKECVPQTIAWINTDPSILIQGNQVVITGSELPCSVGGVISVVSAGQDSVS